MNRPRILDTGYLALLWLVMVMVLFSLISGKQVHYLLPIFPAFLLLAARLAAETPFSFRIVCRRCSCSALLAAGGLPCHTC